jgi:hypothetical protein
LDSDDCGDLHQFGFSNKLEDKKKFSNEEASNVFKKKDDSSFPELRLDRLFERAYNNGELFSLLNSKSVSDDSNESCMEKDIEKTGVICEKDSSHTNGTSISRFKKMYTVTKKREQDKEMSMYDYLLRHMPLGFEEDCWGNNENNEIVSDNNNWNSSVTSGEDGNDIYSDPVVRDLFGDYIFSSFDDDSFSNNDNNSFLKVEKDKELGMTGDVFRRPLVLSSPEIFSSTSESPLTVVNLNVKQKNVGSSDLASSPSLMNDIIGANYSSKASFGVDMKEKENEK